MSLAPEHVEQIRTFFRTLDEADPAAHIDMIDPEVRYFASIFGAESVGRASYVGVRRVTLHDLGISHHRPLTAFGLWPKVAVLVEIHWAPPRGGHVLGIWHLHFGPDGRVQELKIHWDPKGMTDLT